jgi:hypothetical protein
MSGWAAFWQSQRSCRCGHPRWAHPDGLRVRLLRLLGLRAACDRCECTQFVEE